MIKRLIPDNRIGIRVISDDKKQTKILQQPTSYVNGGYYNNTTMQATTIYFGKNRRYFVVLPMHATKLGITLRDELEKLVQPYDTILDEYKFETIQQTINIQSVQKTKDGVVVKN